MSERRKDSKGRVLRTGESERKDGLYQYLMGHSDARTTLNIYTDNVMDKVYESMELLEKRCN